MEFRNELKYLVSAADIALLENRIKGLIAPDSHAAGPEGMYRIRSLYFDDFEDSCYYDNEGGTDQREKWRIRIYNANPDDIHLEVKRKEHGMTQKRSCTITLEQCRELMAGHLLPISAEDSPVLTRFNILMRNRLMRAKVIVEYDRVPFAERLGNTRVTFDRNIRSSSALASFLEPQIPGRPVMPPGQHILEVKYDEFLPDYIYSSLQLNSLERTAYSKYYLCRRFSLNGVC